MTDPFVAHFTLAADVSKQLITLSTGVLALMLTYGNGLGRDISRNAKRTLILTAGVYLASIVFGVLALMTLVGQMEALVGNPSGAGAGIYAGNVRWMAGLQIALFLTGIGMTIRFGYLCVKADSESSEGIQHKNGQHKQ